MRFEFLTIALGLSLLILVLIGIKRLIESSRISHPSIPVIRDRGNFVSLDSLGEPYRFCRRCKRIGKHQKGNCESCGAVSVSKLFFMIGGKQ